MFISGHVATIVSNVLFRRSRRATAKSHTPVPPSMPTTEIAVGRVLFMYHITRLNLGHMKSVKMLPSVLRNAGSTSGQSKLWNFPWTIVTFLASRYSLTAA